MRYAGEVFDGSISRDEQDSTAFWDAGNLSNLERDYGDQASVTVVPNGGGKFRVYEKNDGDPTLYSAHASSPHAGKAQRTGEAYRNPLGTDLYSRVSTAAAEFFGQATYDGVQSDIPVQYVSRGEFNPNAYSPEEQSSHDLYMQDMRRRDYQQWVRGTNSYTTDVEGVKNLARQGRKF